ncbi:sulfotransferase [Sulfuricurvum sp.]|uniref:sulfotransferase family protein n=1 Tax=Sulfuricurvum sp. TaxID=2025608 RepID=UPI0026143983|nr:sulfotransferase [Sulfuricurvum sp.]MDD4950730.1 sulfotransferase [Sulfuricurvum sp.]
MYPSFIIVGAPKAGTTSLYHYLSEHPEVFMSEPKEVNFFSREEIVEQGLYYNDFKAKNLDEYKKLFADAENAKAIGEGSVSYLFYPNTPRKIKDILPDVKIIMLLREPVERGYSHYLMDYRLGLVSLSYDEIVNKSTHHKHAHLYYQQYVELGLYYEQVKRYLDLFGSEQVKIYFQEDLRQDTEKIILDLYDFLEIDRSIMPNIEREHNAFSMPKSNFVHRLYSSYFIRTIFSFIFSDGIKEKIKNTFFETKKKPKLDETLKQQLLEIYRPDIQKLEQLIGRDLSDWYKENTDA